MPVLGSNERRLSSLAMTGRTVTPLYEVTRDITALEPRATASRKL